MHQQNNNRCDKTTCGTYTIVNIRPGITNIINCKYHMNGNVEYAAEGWETYLGRNVHMSGEIIWDEITGFPLEAPGTFRIN